MLSEAYKRLALLISAIILLVPMGVQASAKEVERISRLVVFGDSYSDNGNTYRLTRNLLPSSPPYYEGRFTNGLMWNEYFVRPKNSETQGSKVVLSNYAYGSGMVLRSNIVTLDDDDDEIDTYHIPSLSQEVLLYTTEPAHDLDHTVFVIYMGAVDLALMPEGVDETLFMRRILKIVQGQIDRLVRKGAQHVVVFNIHDFTLSPIWISRAETYAQTHPGVSANVYLANRRHLIQEYNEALREALKSVPQAHYFDINALFAEVISADGSKGYQYQLNDKEYYITNFKLACLNSKTGVICKNPENYFFFDEIHSTTAFEKIIADKFRLFLERVL